MSVFMGNSVQLTINSVDVTQWATSVSGFNTTAADLTTTAMGDSTVTRIGGMQDATFSCTLHNDMAGSAIYATLKDLLGTAVTVTVTPTSGGLSATNPKLSASCLVTELPFIDGAVGDLAEISVTWPVSGAITTTTS